MVDAFFAYHSISTIPNENCDNINIAAEQLKDNLLSKIIQALQTKDPSQECHTDPEDHRTPLYSKHLQNSYLEPGTSILMIRESAHTPKLVVPYKPRSRFLYQVYDCINHSGVTRMHAYPASYWWEYKNRDIEANIESGEICAKRKENYGKRRHWPTGHFKRGKRPFDFVYVDFVSMPVSKGKRYILTILDSFNRHLTTIPCARDRAIDAARGLYSFFLHQREILRIVSSDCRTHFTGEVYKNFCDMISITRELHCSWRTQSFLHAVRR